MPRKAANTKPNPAAKSIPAKPEIVNVSLRLEPKLHERLRKMAFDKREHMHPLIIQAIDNLLKSHKY